MWGFATQAGAGMAIAGLTATYYALAHRNYQGERERLSHEEGNGDGPSVNKYGKIDESLLSLSSSQMLLKKEMEELRAMHGSASGLNVLYQPSHPLYRFQKSRFEITPIISRVNTSPSTLFSESGDEGGANGELEVDVDVQESVFGSGGNLRDDGARMSSFIEERKRSSGFSGVKGDEDDEGLREAVKMMSLVKSGLEVDNTVSSSSKPELKPFEAEVDHGMERDLEEVSAGIEVEEGEESFGEKWKSVQDNMTLNRTTSPICFFKNPGFGSRYAYRIKNEQMGQAAVHPSRRVQEGEVQKDSKGVQVSPKPSSEEYRDSTQFILSPVLSESNVSICDKETPEKTMKSKRRRLRKGKASNPGKEPGKSEAKLMEGSGSSETPTNPLLVISEYNEKLRKRMFQSRKREHMKGDMKAGPLIRLRADPEQCNLCPIAVPVARPGSPPRTNAKPVLLPPELSITPSQQKIMEEEPHLDTLFSEEVAAPDLNSNTEEEKSFDLGTEETNKDDSTTAADCDFSGVLEEPVTLPRHRSDCRIPSRVSSSIAVIRTSESSMVTRIPDDSWIALPIRVCLNSAGTLPWVLFAFCVAVVIVAGIFVNIMSRYANQIIHDREKQFHWEN